MNERRSRIVGRGANELGSRLGPGARDSKTFEAASILRKNMTVPELMLWNKLNDRKIFKTKFRRQHPVSFFIVDFYCHEFKLVIEVDGEIHNETNSDYDLGRTAELNKFGIKVLRFTNDEVFENIDSIIKKILRAVSKDTPFRGQGVDNQDDKLDAI